MNATLHQGYRDHTKPAVISAANPTKGKTMNIPATFLFQKSLGQFHVGCEIRTLPMYQYKIVFITKRIERINSVKFIADYIETIGSDNLVPNRLPAWSR